MAGESLNDFLDDGVPSEPAAIEQAAPELVIESVVEPVVEKPTEKPVEQEPDDELPDDVVKLRAALVATRRDHKGRADRAEGEAAALRAQVAEMAAIRAQLDELKRGQAAPQPPVAPVVPPEPEVVPNPVEDLPGFIAYQNQQQQRALLNERLNLSESLLRDQHGDADVDAKVAIFKKAAAANPALQAEAFRQPHPYKWVYAQAQRIAAMEEIGTDPTAFRAKVEAEARAKWEAEIGAAPRPPEPVLPVSLAGARNSGARTQAEETVPEFDAIFDKGRFTRKSG